MRRVDDGLPPPQVPQEIWDRLLPSQKVAIQKIVREGFSDLYWEYFNELYNRDQGVDHAIVGAWKAVGREGRGKAKTLAAFALVINEAASTLYSRLQQDKLAKEVAALRDLYFKERIAAVDDAAYRDATSQDSTAADKKLFYQLAGVLVGEDAMQRDDWLTMLAQARAEIDPTVDDEFVDSYVEDMNQAPNKD